MLTTGKYFTDRMVSVAGPTCKEPGLFKTRLGANVKDLAGKNQKPGVNRFISGSVFGGDTSSEEAESYLGRFHNQLTLILEGTHREFLGWQGPGFDKFSLLKIFASAAMPGKKFNFNTNTNGSPRAMVPVGTYEKVMPMDIEPSYLLRSLIVGDTDRAIQLGCLELDEEDIALYSFACPR